MASNSVDAEALLRFTLRTLKQLVDRHGQRDRLRAKLLERARRSQQEPGLSTAQQELNTMLGRGQEVREQLAIVGRRMSLEQDDTRYEAIASEFDRLSVEQRHLQARIAARQAALTEAAPCTPEQQVEAALALLEEVQRVAESPQARAEVNPLLQRLGVWIGLSFAGVVKG